MIDDLDDDELQCHEIGFMFFDFNRDFFEKEKHS